ncbi:hypothetical protein Flavo103_13090 [Flavobacterium collinsii]|jgi:hypothetical protein|uniref:cytochrome c oxidase assembly factor Coa1 family protein n=1 Tax=Flavobacterium collinsii TaxID=1114861 RepID=UPI0022BF3436|nr:cytochrome c oxidase assembly factor Coa1 family protein [Flavobacterium collinsii]GIQ58173.1 hypothetical protein Flavo103_13090 [Flavobacterium collinsii]
MEDDYTEVRKSWWDRNWKWFVPTGCLSLLVLFGLFLTGLFFGITSMLKESDSYKAAMNEAQHNTIVLEKLGSPIEDNGIASGSVNSTNSIEHCNLQIPIRGSKSRGTLFVVGTKNGTWNYDEMSLYVEDTKEKIDLLKK